MTDLGGGGAMKITRVRGIAAWRCLVVRGDAVALKCFHNALKQRDVEALRIK
ncbi:MULTISPECIES: hypothetical protein [unclassified Aliiroseovarius]|uniref:hypothetical protein n=1 Tax=unclassified Aliiroseovarius TaxID=2623558 RepID=UPI001569D448|nr:MULTISPECIES: hypothetical protein [unclassified Aliiroseovarius]